MLAIALSLSLATCCQPDPMLHDGAGELITDAHASLEDAQYASAARMASVAAAGLLERLALKARGELEDQTPRSQDIAALATARATMVAAVVRSNGAVDTRGRETRTPLLQAEATVEAMALIKAVRKAAPKSTLARQVEAELQVRSAFSRAQGIATLSHLGAREQLSAPEAMAALATALVAEGAEDAAVRYATLCEYRARWPKQCVAFPTDE
jgi:hypothetical protein